MSSNDAAEIAGLEQHLPGFNFAKSEIQRTINSSSELVAEWVILFGSAKDTTDIKYKIDSLQAEIRANRVH